MTFGDELKAIRESRRQPYQPRLSQSRLADMAGVDHSYISRLETGERLPSRDMVHTIADALGATQIERDRLLTSAGFTGPADATSLALDDVRAERRRQGAVPDMAGWDWSDWTIELSAEMYHVVMAARDNDAVTLREALVRTAAVAVQIIETIDADQQEGEQAA